MKVLQTLHKGYIGVIAAFKWLFQAYTKLEKRVHGHAILSVEVIQMLYTGSLKRLYEAYIQSLKGMC